jgi:hypothetical protein
MAMAAATTMVPTSKDNHKPWVVLLQTENPTVHAIFH